MSTNPTSRRGALKSACGALLVSGVSGLSGCGGAAPAVAEAGRVVVQIAPRIAKILSAMVSIAKGVIEIVVLLATGEKETITYKLTDDQIEMLKHGGDFFIRSHDGKESPIKPEIH